MKTFKNEKGYALLMVLMLILLFTVLGMGLMATNMNSATQFNTKENQVQARHQAEMGVLHYGVILQDKINSASTAAINCSDIDALLGPTRKLAEGDYAIEPAGALGSSCTEVANSKLLEITIKSKGIINGNTEKEVEATFYAENQGVLTDGDTGNKVIGPPALPTGENTETFDELELKKETEVFEGNLIVEEHLNFLPGNGNNLIVKNDLYIAGLISMKNHDCISTGGNFTALQSFDWGNSHTDLLVRKDAYLPSEIGGWKKDHTNLYVFGDLYLPKTYRYNIIAGERELYVGGKVYQNINDAFVEIPNPFKILGEDQISAVNKLSCAVSAIADESPGTPKWVLQDEKIINYQ